LCEKGWKVQSMIDLAPPETFQAELIKTRMLSPSVKEFTFKRVTTGSPSLQEPLRFAAGQWLNLHLNTAAGTLKRAYSIASAPNANGSFELAITLVENGPGSTYLHALPLGAKIDVTGPQGLFLRQLAGPSLFVGTGTGVTPLRSMFRAALEAGETSPMHLIFGVREEADRLYHEEFEALSRQHTNFRVTYTLSRASQSWSGKTGYVQTHVQSLYEELATAGECHVYICGLTKMITQVRDLLRKDMQLPRQLVHSERYD
jgi:CDP-4-dehydro-6-deoxyglucose reductase, E3